MSKTPPTDYQLKFRIPLPSKPIISKEMDEKFLYYNVIEKMEKAKVIAGTPDRNANLSEISTARSWRLGLSSIVFFFIPFWLYRRFRYKKNNSALKSGLKSFAISAFFIILTESINNFGAEFNHKIFLSELLKTSDANMITQYIQFKEEYEKINKVQV